VVVDEVVGGGHVAGVVEAERGGFDGDGLLLMA
jgi:hypothetical protein